jgi:c-di-GMP-binding flagellar brake protein YcgR
MEATEQTASTLQNVGKIAEAALRNLHLDCFSEDNGAKPFTSRMREWDGAELLIDPPQHQGRPVELAPGERVVCSCRLGQEVIRFTATAAGPACLPGDDQRRTSAVRLASLGNMQVIQRRRYYRVSLAGREPSEVTCWLVDQDESGSASVCSKFMGRITDLSTGGVGVEVANKQVLDELEGRQIWVRFVLPTENESLIFRAESRYARALDEGEGYRIGLEFMEYIEPGQHSAVIEKLARFVALGQPAKDE